MQTLNFINGEFRPARSEATDEVINPATGELICEVASGDESDAQDAVAAAEAAFEGWARTTPRQRFELISKLADAIEGDLDNL